MATKEARRHRRIPYPGPVRLSWEDPHRGAQFAQGRCIDLSETGTRIELPIPIPVYAAVSLTTNQVGVSGSASVKNVSRFGAKYLIGLQFNQPLPPKIRESLREPPAPPSSDSV
jgi:PilZ domain-containing protein